MKKLISKTSVQFSVFGLVLLFVAQGLAATGLKNGQTLEVVNDDVPLEYMSLVFPGGAGIVDVKKQGLTRLLSEIFEKGPKGLSEQDYKRELFMKNLSIGFGANNRAFVAYISAPKDRIVDGLKMVKRILSNPKFEQEVFDEVKVKATRQTISRFEKMSTFIFHFGPDKAFKAHPAFRDGVGTPSSFKKISLNDLQAYQKKNIDFKQASVFVLGNSKKTEIAQAVNSNLLSDISAKPAAKMDLPLVSFKSFSNEKMIFHKKAAVDNQILWIMPFDVKPYTKEYVVAQMAMQVLGGGSGHLVRTLREKRGLTYHAGSYLRRINNEQSYWMIYTFGKTENVPKLLKAIPEVFSSLKKTGVTLKEMADARSKIRTSIKQNYELPKDELDYLVRAHLYGYPKDGIKMFLKYLDEVNLQEVNGFIAKSLDLKRSKKYLMGDKKQVSKYFKRAKVLNSEDLL